MRSQSSPAKRERGIPEWLDRAVLKCLSKDPAERFQSMDALYDFLRNSHRLTLASAEMVASIASESRSRKLGVEYDRNTATQLVDPGVPAPVMETQERLATSLGPETRFRVMGSPLESTLVSTPCTFTDGSTQKVDSDIMLFRYRLHLWSA